MAASLMEFTIAAFEVLPTTSATDTYTAKINPGKYAAIPIVFFLILFACAAPHILLRLKHGAAFALALATCLSGGAMLGIGLIHILPHANEYWELYLVPDGCGSHAGHAHFYQPGVIEHEYTVPTQRGDLVLHSRESESNEVAVSSLINSNRLMQLKLAQNEHYENYNFDQTEIDTNSTQKQFKPLQSIEPIDPIDLIPTPEASVEGCPEGDLFPYAELCCGLVILLLMAVESLLHSYLSGRIGSVHLHEHGGPDDHCGGNHAHAHHQHLNHSHHHHKDGQECHDSKGACPNEVIELSTVDANNSSGNGETTPPSQDSSEKSPQKDHDHHHEHSHHEHSVSNANETESEKKRRLLIEDDQTDDGVKLSPDEMKKHQFRRTVDAYISAVAISLHCIFNGLSLGVFSASNQSQVSQFWTLFGATIGHKLMDGFAVGIPLMRANLSRPTTIIIALLVSFSTPVGIAIGLGAANVQNNGRYLAQAVLMSLSSGSFFYIALLELLPSGTKGKDRILLKWLFVGIGFGGSAFIARWA